MYKYSYTTPSANGETRANDVATGGIASPESHGQAIKEMFYCLGRGSWTTSWAKGPANLLKSMVIPSELQPPSVSTMSGRNSTPAIYRNELLL